MRILMVANYLPYPVLSGGRLRIYHLLRRVAQHHEVSLAALLESPDDRDGIPHLRQFCHRVETAGPDRRRRWRRATGMIRYALEGNPPDLSLLHSDELAEKIRRLAASEGFDIVQMESVMGLYLDALPRPRMSKTVLMFQNVAAAQFARITRIERSRYRKLRSWINGTSLRRWEPRYAERFDRATTVSDADKELLRRLNPRLQVEVIPNGVDTEALQPLPPTTPKPPSLLFIGSMSYPPCVDAVLMFCEHILPLVRQAVPGIELRIVGADPHPAVQKLAGNGVQVTGRVQDVVAYYRDCTVCIVPLRAGGGTRLKILEAMALGRPVVSTTIGCEGLDVVHGTHLLVADTPEKFADATIRAVRDAGLRDALCANARRLVEARYGWNRIAGRLMDLYQSLAEDPAAVGIGG
jgi:sugar transferase (PEP-CTERM/EpsH1 system associated)